MKKIFKLMAVVAAIAGAVWAARGQLLPGPSAPTSQPPPFRNPPPKPDQHQPETAAQQGDQDDLTKINGIGPVYSQRLSEAGITTFAELAAADAEWVAAAIDVPAERVADWTAAAANLS